MVYTGFHTIQGFRNPQCLGTHPLWIRGEYSICFDILDARLGKE